MDALKRHVDSLFVHYSRTKEIDELKDEILTNLEAKVKDLTSEGLDYDAAVKTSVDSISSVDYLIEDSKKIYINRFRLELLQVAVLYLVIAWIVTIPLRINSIGVIANTLILIGTAAAGIVYLAINLYKNQESMHRIKIYSIQAAFKGKKVAWLIWGIFIFLVTLRTTALRFGSNIWFSRPVRIDGPYEFANIVISYLLPFVTVIVPLLFSEAAKLIFKYEVGVENEK
jgi:hypothetical protein